MPTMVHPCAPPPPQRCRCAEESFPDRMPHKCVHMQAHTDSKGVCLRLHPNCEEKVIVFGLFHINTCQGASVVQLLQTMR